MDETERLQTLATEAIAATLRKKCSPQCRWIVGPHGDRTHGDRLLVMHNDMEGLWFPLAHDPAAIDRELRAWLRKGHRQISHQQAGA